MGAIARGASRGGRRREELVRAVAAALAVAGCVGCSHGAPSATEGEGPGLGEIMVNVGRRFELAGRAAAANRFELAEFEAAELGELFESDVPHATLPKGGPTAQIPGLAKAFLESAPPDLAKAAASKDKVKFAAAFERAAVQCNGCHMSADKGFIQVPTVPGQAVPVLDPLPAPAISAASERP